MKSIFQLNHRNEMFPVNKLLQMLHLSMSSSKGGLTRQSVPPLSNCISDFHVTHNAFCFPQKICINYCQLFPSAFEDNSLCKILWGKQNALWFI